VLLRDREFEDWLAERSGFELSVPIVEQPDDSRPL